MDTADWLEEKVKAASGSKDGWKVEGADVFVRNSVLEKRYGQKAPIGRFGEQVDAELAMLGRAALPVLAAALRALKKWRVYYELGGAQETTAVIETYAAIALAEKLRPDRAAAAGEEE